MSDYNVTPELGDELVSMRRRIEALERLDLRSAGGRSPWVAPSLVTGWANVGLPDPPAGYYSDALGRVFMRGVVHHAAGGGTFIFQLPQWFRPLYRHFFPSNSTASPWIYVDADGWVQAPVPVPAGTSVSLDNVQFRNI